jgi:ribonucleoside-triphosphate reductase
MEYANNVKNEYFCHDCEKAIIVKNGRVKNGVYLVYDNFGEKYSVFKCNDCFTKSIALSDFQKCEVYSRVVGYLRPVSQWNYGKQKEYGDRLEYEI